MTSPLEVSGVSGTWPQLKRRRYPDLVLVLRMQVECAEQDRQREQTRPDREELHRNERMRSPGWRQLHGCRGWWGRLRGNVRRAVGRDVTEKDSFADAAALALSFPGISKWWPGSLFSRKSAFVEGLTVIRCFHYNPGNRGRRVAAVMSSDAVRRWVKSHRPGSCSRFCHTDSGVRAETDRFFVSRSSKGKGFQGGS